MAAALIENKNQKNGIVVIIFICCAIGLSSLSVV
jgi:hypothetical protein